MSDIEVYPRLKTNREMIQDAQLEISRLTQKRQDALRDYNRRLQEIDEKIIKQRKKIARLQHKAVNRI